MSISSFVGHLQTFPDKGKLPGEVLQTVKMCKRTQQQKKRAPLTRKYGERYRGNGKSAQDAKEIEVI